MSSPNFEQIASAQKANAEVMTALLRTALNGMERLTALNMAAGFAVRGDETYCDIGCEYAIAALQRRARNLAVALATSDRRSQRPTQWPSRGRNSRSSWPSRTAHIRSMRPGLLRSLR